MKSEACFVIFPLCALVPCSIDDNDDEDVGFFAIRSKGFLIKETLTLSS